MGSTYIYLILSATTSSTVTFPASFAALLRFSHNCMVNRRESFSLDFVWRAATYSATFCCIVDNWDRYSEFNSSSLRQSWSLCSFCSLMSSKEFCRLKIYYLRLFVNKWYYSEVISKNVFQEWDFVCLPLYHTLSFVTSCCVGRELMYDFAADSSILVCLISFSAASYFACNNSNFWSRLKISF